MDTLHKYVVQAEGRSVFCIYYNDMFEALKEAERIAKKENVAVRVLQVAAVVKPKMTLGIWTR